MQSCGKAGKKNPKYYYTEIQFNSTALKVFSAQPKSRLALRCVMKEWNIPAWTTQTGITRHGSLCNAAQHWSSLLQDRPGFSLRTGNAVSHHFSVSITVFCQTVVGRRPPCDSLREILSFYEPPPCKGQRLTKRCPNKVDCRGDAVEMTWYIYVYVWLGNDSIHW